MTAKRSAIKRTNRCGEDWTSGTPCLLFSPPTDAKNIPTWSSWSGGHIDRYSQTRPWRALLLDDLILETTQLHIRYCFIWISIEDHRQKIIISRFLSIDCLFSSSLKIDGVYFNRRRYSIKVTPSHLQIIISGLFRLRIFCGDVRKYESIREFCFRYHKSTIWWV